MNPTPLIAALGELLVKGAKLQMRALAVGAPGERHSVTHRHGAWTAGRGTCWLATLAATLVVGASGLAQVAPKKSAPASPVETRGIEIAAKFFEVPAKAFSRVKSDEAMDPEAAKELVSKVQHTKGAAVVSTPQVMTHSGQTATIEIGQDYPIVGKSGQMFVGLSLEAKPQLIPKGIWLEVTARVVRAPEESATAGRAARFQEHKSSSKINLQSGYSVVLPRMPAKEAGREMLVIVTASTKPQAETVPSPKASSSPKGTSSTKAGSSPSSPGSPRSPEIVRKGEDESRVSGRLGIEVSSGEPRLPRPRPY